MSTKRNRKPTPPPASPGGLTIPLLLVTAFALGAGLMWGLLRARSSSATREVAIENFLPPSGKVPPVQALPASPPVAGPPNVSQLPPADAARTLANWNYDQQNWVHAIEHYEQAIAAGADNSDVRTDLGNCFRFLGQPQKALEQYELAQKQNPQHENSLFNQISLFSDSLNDKNRAAAAARDFITRFPLSPQAAKAQQQLGASNPASTP